MILFFFPPKKITIGVKLQKMMPPSLPFYRYFTSEIELPVYFQYKLQAASISKIGKFSSDENDFHLVSKSWNEPSS